MTVNIDWELMQSPNVMANYLQGLQLRNELGRQQGRTAMAQQGAGPDVAAGGPGDGSDWREPASWDLLSGVHALRQLPVGDNGDTSGRREAARQMLPALMQRYPNLDPQALQHLDLSDEGLSRAESYLLGG